MQSVVHDVLHARPPHEQPVRVDSVRRAGHEGHIVLTGDYVQPAQIARQYRRDLVDRIRVSLVEDVDLENVAVVQLVEIREQLRPGQSPVSADDGVRALSPDREARPFDMPRRDLEHRFARSVIDAEEAGDRRDLDVADHAVSEGIEDRIIFGDLLVGQHFLLDDLPGGEASVPLVRGVEVCGVLLFVDVHDVFGVGRDGAGLVEGVPVVRKGRVQQQGEPCKKKQDKGNIDDPVLHKGFSVPLNLDRFNGLVSIKNLGAGRLSSLPCSFSSW